MVRLGFIVVILVKQNKNFLWFSSHAKLTQPLCLEDWLPVSTHLTSILPSDWPAYYIRRGWTALSVVHTHVFVRHTNHLNKMNDWRCSLGGAFPAPQSPATGSQTAGTRKQCWHEKPGAVTGPGCTEAIEAHFSNHLLAQCVSLSSSSIWFCRLLKGDLCQGCGL